jgi:DNA polymerase I-like protein with 3'-5' exonuclease and polymerase domains
MIISLDIETACSVDGCPGFGGTRKCDHAFHHLKNKITLIGCYWEDENGKENYRVFRDSDQGAFRDFLGSLPDSAVFVGHNFKFDLKTLWAKGCVIPPERWSHDTICMGVAYSHKVPEQWLGEYDNIRKQLNKSAKREIHRKAGKYSLKTMAPYFAQTERFWETSEHDNEEYVIKDAKYTYKLFKALQVGLIKDGSWDFYQNKLMPWNKFLFDMEMRGLPISREKLEEIEVQVRADIITLKHQLDEIWAPAYRKYFYIQRRKLYREYIEKYRGKTRAQRARAFKSLQVKVHKMPMTMNLDSPAQLNWLLKTYLKYDIRDAEGEEGTGKSVLEKLILEGKEDLKIFSDYRKKTKIISSFIEPYKELIIDGRIYTNFNIGGAKTGRLSSSDINCQQIPPILKPAFQAPAGYKMVSYDLSGIEPVVIAFLSEDLALCKALIDGHNFHNHVTKSIIEYVNCPIEDVKKLYPKERNLCKTLDLSWFYGSGLNRTMVTCNNHKFNWSEADARQKLRKFKQTYQGVFAFKQELDNLLVNGPVEGIMGRKWVIDDPEEIYMHGFNGLVQGSASDMLLNSAAMIDKEFKELGIDAGALAIVHDEVLFLCPVDYLDICEEIIKQKMTGYVLENIHGRIPIEVEGGAEDYWKK